MGRIIAIDFGDRRIGIALSDPLQIIASPYDIIDRKITPDYLLELERIINEKAVTQIVVGIPLTMKNKDSQQTTKVREFIAELKLKFSLPIHLTDERMSSISAQKILIEKGVKTGHNKGEIDKVAASIMLKEYLDSI
jgi:putative holliday junction resolvase